MILSLSQVCVTRTIGSMLYGPSLRNEYRSKHQADVIHFESLVFLQSCLNHLFFRYSEGEIRFNLMAIVSDRKMIYEKKIVELQAQLTEVRPSDCYILE